MNDNEKLLATVIAALRAMAAKIDALLADCRPEEFTDPDGHKFCTKREVKWSAWRTNVEDGVIGTGSTEIEAIKALADQYRDLKDEDKM